MSREGEEHMTVRPGAPSDQEFYPGGPTGQELYDEAVRNFVRPDPAALGKEPWELFAFHPDPALSKALLKPDLPAGASPTPDTWSGLPEDPWPWEEEIRATIGDAEPPPRQSDA